MDEIIVMIGQDAAAKLSESFGGTSLYIGKASKESVSNAIGQQAALKLSEVYDGCLLYIPNAKAAKIAARNKAIKADKAAGLDIRDLVGKYQLSNRRIFSICA